MRRVWDIGDLIDHRWEVVKILGGRGKSGMGIVYVVAERETGSVFAVKTFQDEAAMLHADIEEYFANESAIWLMLGRHPNVVEALFVEHVGGKPHLFLEYVEGGGDLSGYVETRRLTNDVEQVFRLSFQLCDALAHIKAAGVEAHGDIKPRNCLINGSGELKLSDFGAAHMSTSPRGTRRLVDWLYALRGRRGKSQDAAAEPEVRPGTSAYMAPELLEGTAAVNATTDVYAVGILLYELLTGRHPFEGVNADERGSDSAAQYVPASSFSTQGGVSVRAASLLDEVLRRCLAHDPSDRIRDALELRKSLAKTYENAFGRPAPAPSVGGTESNLLERAGSLLALGRSELALGLCDRALAGGAKSSAAWALRGSTLMQLDRPRRALRDLNKALELDSENALAWEGRALALAALGRFDEADAALGRLLQLDPSSAAAHITRGRVLCAAGRDDEGQLYLDAARTLEPDMPEQFFQLGEAYKLIGRDEDALSCYEEALARAFRHEGAAVGKGQMLVKLGRNTEAYDWSSYLTSTFPQNPDGWIIRGLSALNHAVGNGLDQTRGELLAAEHETRECLERAKALGSKPAEMMLGRLDKDFGKNPVERVSTQWGEHGPEGAIAELDRLISDDPEEGDDFWFMKGMFFGQKGEWADALACFERAFEGGKRDSEIYYFKGRTLLSLGRTDEAHSCFREALALDENNAGAWYGLAMWQYYCDAPRNAFAIYAALDSLDRALAINKRHPLAWHLKGEILDKGLGRKAEAEECEKRAMSVLQYDAEFLLRKGAGMLQDTFGFNQKDEHRKHFEAAEVYLKEAAELGHPQAARFLKVCRELMKGL